jgi:hypothetical protein
MVVFLGLILRFRQVPSIVESVSSYGGQLYLFYRVVSCLMDVRVQRELHHFLIELLEEEQIMIFYY